MKSTQSQNYNSIFNLLIKFKKVTRNKTVYYKIYTHLKAYI